MASAKEYARAIERSAGRIKSLPSRPMSQTVDSIINTKHPSQNPIVQAMKAAGVKPSDFNEVARRRR